MDQAAQCPIQAAHWFDRGRAVLQTWHPGGNLCWRSWPMHHGGCGSPIPVQGQVEWDPGQPTPLSALAVSGQGRGWNWMASEVSSNLSHFTVPWSFLGFAPHLLIMQSYLLTTQLYILCCSPLPLSLASTVEVSASMFLPLSLSKQV